MSATAVSSMFRQGNHDISRLEAFSDAVFAFALTLLVVSLDVPYVVLFAMFGMLYLHAHRRRANLQLTPLEVFEVRVSGGAHLVSAAVGLAATAVALFAPWRLPVFSGFTYFLMGPAHWIYGVRSARRRKAIEAGLQAVPQASGS